MSDERDGDLDRSKLMDLIASVASLAEQNAGLTEKMESFISTYSVPLEYIKSELAKKKRRDELIDKVQENVTTWVIIGVLGGVAAGAAWVFKLVFKNFSVP